MKPWWLITYVLAVVVLCFAIAFAHETLKRWFWRRESNRQRGFEVKLNPADPANSAVTKTKRVKL